MAAKSLPAGLRLI